MCLMNMDFVVTVYVLPHVIFLLFASSRFLLSGTPFSPSLKAVQPDGKAVGSSARTRVVVMAITRITSEVLRESFRVTDQALHSLAPPDLQATLKRAKM